MGEWKLLLPWPQPSYAAALATPSVSCVVEATVAAALASGCRVILVGGYRGAELAARFAGWRDVVLVQNPAWELGMLGSIQAGLSALESPSFLTIPADMPLVDPPVYASLLGALGGREEAGLPELPLFASYRGEAGHPVFVPSRFVSRIASLPPGLKLRPFLLGEGALLVDSGEEAVLLDLDDREAYEAAMRRARSIA